MTHVVNLNAYRVKIKPARQMVGLRACGGFLVGVGVYAHLLYPALRMGKRVNASICSL